MIRHRAYVYSTLADLTLDFQGKSPRTARWRDSSNFHFCIIPSSLSLLYCICRFEYRDGSVGLSRAIDKQLLSKFTGLSFIYGARLAALVFVPIYARQDVGLHNSRDFSKESVRIHSAKGAINFSRACTSNGALTIKYAFETIARSRL